MIINGVNITSGTKETDLELDNTAKKTNNKKTESAAKKNSTDENDLVELSFDDNSDEDSKLSSYEEAISQAQKQQEEELRSCLEQLQNLMKQLSDLNQQQTSLATEISNGGDISTLQTSLQGITSQKKQVYTNITTMLMNISQYEQQMAAANESMQGLLDQIKTTTASINDLGGSSLDSTGNVNATTFKSTGSGNLSKYNAKRGSALANAAKSLYGGVTKGNSLCATGVSQAIQKAFGYTTHGNGCDYGNVLAGRNDWVEITDQVKGVEDLKNLPAGAIVSWSVYNTTSLGSKYGHVYITDGAGHGISDFTENISSYYMDRNSKYRVFIPV